MIRHLLHSLATPIVLWPLGLAMGGALIGGLLGLLDVRLSRKFHHGDHRIRDPHWFEDQVRADTAERLRRLQSASRSKGDVA